MGRHVGLPLRFRNCIHQTIPRFRADIGMNHIPPQQTLIFHPRFFHHLRRGGIVHITGGADAIDVGLTEEPVRHSAGGFGHVALAPVRTRQHVTDTRFESIRVDGDHADEGIIPLQCDGVGERLAVPPKFLDQVKDGIGLVHAFVRTPRQVARHFGILGVGGKHDGRVVPPREAEVEPVGGEGWRRVHELIIKQSRRGANSV